MDTAIKLLPGERVVLSDDQDILVVTNMRVRCTNSVNGATQLTSITLDSVASVGLVAKSNIVLLVAAAAVAVVGIGLGNDATLVMFGIAAALVVAYYLTKRKVISIASNGGGSIYAPASGLDHSMCMRFVEAIEREKLAYTGARMSQRST